MKRYLLIPALISAPFVCGQAGDIITKPPYVSMKAEDFEKAWAAAKDGNSAPGLARLDQKKAPYVFVRGDGLHVFLFRDFSYDFEGVLYQAVLADVDGKEIERQAYRISQMAKWVRERGRTPKSMNLPVDWYKRTRPAVTLRFRFVQNGHRYESEAVTP